VPMHGKSREASERFAERRRREDEAPRLRDEAPELRTLRLVIEESRGTTSLAEARHVRIVIVDRAPALFMIPCGDNDCRDGGHDVTRELMNHVRAKDKEFVVKDSCLGTVRDVPCGRTVIVKATATHA
jgi:hypothetical protein